MGLQGHCRALHRHCRVFKGLCRVLQGLVCSALQGSLQDLCKVLQWSLQGLCRGALQGIAGSMLQRLGEMVGRGAVLEEG